MTESNYEIIEAGNGRYVKAWKKGVAFEQPAIQQLIAAAQLSVVGPYVAAMPDCHMGYGSTVGSVIPTKDAVIPAAVGVDIGCGMIYQPLGITRDSIPGDLAELRHALEKAVPNGGPGAVGSWEEHVPQRVRTVWMNTFSARYDAIGKKHPNAVSKFGMNQLGTLGTGNHFLELTISGGSWNRGEVFEGELGILIHSGSRGLGNKIGTYFTHVAREYASDNHIGLPDRDLAYLPLGTPDFDDYLEALQFSQQYAWENRLLMLEAAKHTILQFSVDRFQHRVAVHCHHNYMEQEYHGGEWLFITRKGAVRAGLGDLGIIPGSMGARTYIVRGLGSENSFRSCSHGAGRTMSRTQAKKQFTVADHVLATQGVECDKTEAVLDETPQAYKPIEAVIAAQTDLIEPLFHMRQILCVKGLGESKKWDKKNRNVETV